MKLLSKRALIKTLIAILVVYLSGVVVVSFIVRSQWFSEQVRVKLERGLGRRVTFSSIEPSLLFGVGARVRDFAIYEDDKKTPFIQAEGILLKVRLLPLLRRVLSIGKVSLDRPQLRLIREEGGDWNFDSLIKKEKPAAGEARGGPLTKRKKPRVIISSLRIRGGVLTVFDPSLQREFILSDLDLKAANITPDAVPYVKLSSRFYEGRLRAVGKVTDLGRKPSLDIKFSGRSLPLAQLGSLDVPNLSLDGNVSLDALLKGSVEDMDIDVEMDLGGSSLTCGEFFEKSAGSRAALRFDGHFDGKAIRWGNSLVELGDMSLETSGSLGLGGNRPLEVRVKRESLDLAGLNDFLSAPVVVKGKGEINILTGVALKSPGDTAEISGKVKIVGGELRFQRLKNTIGYDVACSCEGKSVRVGLHTLSMGSTLGEGNIVFYLGEEPSFDCELNFPVIDTADFASAPVKEKTVFEPRFFSLVTEAAAEPAVSIENDQLIPPFARKVKGVGRVTIGELRLGKLRAVKGQAKFSLSDGVARIDSAHLELYRGVSTGSFVADLGEAVPDYTFKGSMTDLNLAMLLSDIYGYTNVFSGKLFSEIEAKGAGRDWLSVRKSLNARGRFYVKEGNLRSIGFLRDIGPLFVLLGQQAKMKEFVAFGGILSKAPAETSLSRCEGNFRFEDQHWGTGDLILEIADNNNPMALRMEGTMGLNGELDFTGQAFFPKGSPGYNRLAAYFPDDEGWIKVPFPIPIGGTLDKPRVDLNASKKSIVKCAKEIGKLRFRKELEKKIDERLAPRPKKGEKPDAGDVGREILKGTSKELLKKLIR